MSLKEALEAANKAAPGFDQWLASLPKDLRSQLVATAANPNVGTQKLVDIIRGEGVKIGWDRAEAWRLACGFVR